MTPDKVITLHRQSKDFTVAHCGPFKRFNQIHSIELYAGWTGIPTHCSLSIRLCISVIVQLHWVPLASYPSGKLTVLFRPRTGPALGWPALGISGSHVKLLCCSVRLICACPSAPFPAWCVSLCFYHHHETNPSLCISPPAPSFCAASFCFQECCALTGSLFFKAGRCDR